MTRLKGDPDLSDIPVVFLTGRTSTDDMVAGLRAGAHDYLKKPFEPAELIARIGDAVRIKRLQDELRIRNEQLDRLSRIDGLTGLYNRRHLDEQLLEMNKIACRHGQPLAVLMLDIDHFKRVNDEQGHPAGDQSLEGRGSQPGDYRLTTATAGARRGFRHVREKAADEPGSPRTVRRVRRVLGVPSSTEVTLIAGLGTPSGR